MYRARFKLLNCFYHRSFTLLFYESKFSRFKSLGTDTPASSGDNRAVTFAGVGNTITPGQGTNIPAQTVLREGWFMLKNYH